MYNNCGTRVGETVFMLSSNVLDTKEEGVGGGYMVGTFCTTFMFLCIINFELT